MNRNQNIRDIADIIQQRIDASLNEGRPARSERVKIGNEFKSLPVISLPTSFAYFNPHNHRLSAQIKDSKLANDVFENPFSENSQKLILRLLSETEEFGKLKEELKELGQRHPGLIMRDGLLVNGNTRCAGLKILGEDGLTSAKTIDVAVLPEGITEVDISDIEMELQMLTLTHQKYTFTNELLFMHNYRRSGKSDNELITAMGWQKGKRGETKVKKYMRVLGYIDEVKEINSDIKYEVFNSKRTHLFDLDEKMQALINEGDEQGAIELKYQRILALFMGLGKDHVREIDGEFFHKVLMSINEGESTVKSLVQEHPSHETDFDDDFDDIDNQESLSIVDANALLKTYLTKTTDYTGDETGTFKENDVAFSELTTILADATERSIQGARQDSRNQELSITMRGIRTSISAISDKLPERTRENGFKSGDFQFELNKALKELERVQREFDRFKI